MKKILTTLLLGAGLVLLTGCAAGTTPAAETPAAAEVVTEAPAAAAPTAETVDNCVDCHTNKQMLIDTAKPEEHVESESEGVG